MDNALSIMRGYMENQTNWFFSWNAYDATSGEHLPMYSYGEVYACNSDICSEDVFEELMAEKHKLRRNLRIHCIAFNKA